MPQEIFTQLEQVCRRRSQRRWLTATCWALVAALAAALLFVGIDRTLGIVDPVGRGLLTIAFVVSCVFVLRRWLAAVSTLDGTPLDVAHEVERQHPDLRDVVANAWEFSRQADGDLTAGSESLRRATVLRAAASVSKVDWQQLIPRKPLRQAALGLASVGLMLGLLGWCLPQSMAIGFTRLANPLSRVEWPREHDLQFVKPKSLLAAGEDLVLQLRDTRGALPATITMHYRNRRQRRWHEETQLLLAQGNSLKIRRTNVQESLQYRATGADHQTMPWHSLEVLEPPRAERLQVTVHPPAYTGLPVKILDQGISIFAGSELALQGHTDQRVKQVVLQSASGERIAATVGPKGKSFKIEPTDWRVKNSDTYTLQLTTTAGLTCRAATKLTLDVIDDQPPQVRFVEPLGDLTLLPNVALPLVIEANDELALREIQLNYRRSDRPQAGELRLPLWASVQAESNRGQRQLVEFLWQLEHLKLEPGYVVEVRATASDFQPRMGQTKHALRLNIVSEDELWRQILEQQTRLAESLAKLLREQRELHGITEDWAESPDWSSSRWANACHVSLFRQRQISDTLVGSPSSLVGQLAGLIQSIERNNLLRPEVADRLLAAHAQLQTLADEPLAAVEQSLSEIVRQSRQSATQEKLRPLIASTAEHQEQTLVGLRRVIDLLTPGNVLGQLERDLAEIEINQQSLTDHCQAELAPQMFLSESTEPELQATIASAARRQRDLARRLAELLLNVTQASRRLATDETGLAARLAATVSLAVKLEIQGTIQAAADQLARRRLGRTATLQRQVLEQLSKLRASLAGHDMEGTSKRFKALQATEQELQRLRRQVAAHERELRQLNPDERQLELLRRQRKKMAAQAEKISRQLERLRIPKAAKPASDAAARLRRATLDSETTQQARQQLDNAQRQLTTARRRQQVALARLQLAQLDTKLKAFVGTQVAIQQEILRLKELHEATGLFSQAQEQSVLLLTDRQAALREEVIAQADQLTTLPVFAHLLRMASKTTQTVEARLLQLKLNQLTSSFAEEAVRQLMQLASAVRQERKNLSPSKQSQGRGGQRQNGDTAQSQTLQLALGQLQLLKSLQAALHEKTITLETQQSADQPPTHSASELARQQRQLTELARQLVPESPDPPTEKLFPNLEQELERSLEEITLP